MAPRLAHHEVDPPADPSADWWVRLVVDDFSTDVVWNPDRGFGLFTSESDAYGARPDEVFGEPGQAATRLLQLVDDRNVLKP